MKKFNPVNIIRFSYFENKNRRSFAVFLLLSSEKDVILNLGSPKNKEFIHEV